jgi:pullulanase
MKSTRLSLNIFLGLVLILLPMESVYAGNGIQAPPAYQEMVFSTTGVAFNLWAPEASLVRVSIYENARGGVPNQTVVLTKGRGDIWETSFNNSVVGKFYTFQILFEGNWLPETPGIQASAVGVNGTRGAIIDLSQTNPPGWDSDVRPPLNRYTDMVVYELNICDFSMGKQSGIVNKGKYLSLTEKGSTNQNAFATGLDHLVDLGITHVLLMPVFDFANDDESRSQHCLRYWNFNPLNFNVPEGMYATRPFDPVSRIREFKSMVQALHQAGIRVMMEVAYDHTAFAQTSGFSRTVPGLFYRYKPDGTLSDGSGYGNEVATEQPFPRDYILRSLLYWIKEYHLDGFCFDQLGVLDIETINQIRESIDLIDPTIFVGGEGLSAGESSLSENSRGLFINNVLMPRIALFDDVFANAVKGKATDSMDIGFISGKPFLEEYIRFGIVGGVRHPQVNAAGSPGFGVSYALSPKEHLQYVSSHKGFTLYDQLNASSGRKERPERLLRRNKLANSMVMTSQGIPFIYSGEEMMRSREGLSGTVDTPDSLCRLDWRNKTYYNDLYEFYYGMLELRRSHPAFRMDKTETVQKHLRFLDGTEKGVVGFTMNAHPNGDSWKDILVIHNGKNQSINVDVPPGIWTTVVLDGKVDLLGLSSFSEGWANVPATSTLVAFMP